MKPQRFNALAPALAALLLVPVGDAAAADGRKIARNGTNAGAPACKTCHGMDGAGRAAGGFPRLAGLEAAYMVRQIQAYADGTRANATMKPIAKALSASQARAVATYYADQKASGRKPDGKAPAAGRRLATIGKWSKTVPACNACHGPGGRGGGADFPAIAGQHESYLVAQLKAWRKGRRTNDPNGLMAAVAKGLTAKEVQAVAAYYARQSAP